MKAWTDYPFEELGDTVGAEAPLRECQVLSYDGDKYCEIMVAGISAQVKSGYLYGAQGRYGEVPKLNRRVLHSLPRTRWE